MHAHLQVLKVANTQVNLEEVSNLCVFFSPCYICWCKEGNPPKKALNPGLGIILTCADLLQNNNFKSFATDSLAEVDAFILASQVERSATVTLMSFANSHQPKHLKKYRP